MRATVCIMILSCVTGLVSAPLFGQSQAYSPVRWDFKYEPVSAKEVALVFTASLDDGWHIYSQFIDDGGPLPTSFTFDPSPDYMLVKKVEEAAPPHKSFDPTFMMEMIWFEGQPAFVQRAKLRVPSTTIKGKIEFMVCSDDLCMPPEEVSFRIDVQAEKQEKKKSASLRSAAGSN